MSYYKRITKILAEKEEIQDDEADSAIMTETEKFKKYGPIVKTFKSKSNPNRDPYEVRRIKGQDPTCNCRGWATHRKCVHTDEVKRLHIAASAVADLVNKYFKSR